MRKDLFMFESNNPIEQTAEMLTSAKDYASEYLEGNPSVLLLVTSSLTQLINKLNFMIGRQMVSTPAEEHPPITNFMGEEITYASKIKKADLTPEQADREAYRNKVERLYTQIGSIAPQGLLNSYTLPDDQIVIRGVAKLAGVEGYEDREIDEDFLEDIDIAIKKKAADEAALAEIERKLQLDQQATKAQAISEEDDDDEDEPKGNEDEKKAAEEAQRAGTTTGKKKPGNK